MVSHLSDRAAHATRDEFVSSHHMSPTLGSDMGVDDFSRGSSGHSEKGPESLDATSRGITNASFAAKEQRAMPLSDRQRWAELNAWLEALLELDAGARESRLAELRTRHATLADELASMLRSAERVAASGFLAGNALGDSATPPTLVGEQIGAYRIEAPLGQGGTGSVWRARRADGRHDGAVAIKLLHLSLVGRSGARRFEREGAILARLTHPNIAHLLDAGVTAAGQPFLVLELVEGQRIDHHCDALRLTIEQRLALFDDVLSAVAQAHSHLVVHRDIKPNNILVSAEGQVKLLDFGIAKILQQGAEDSPVTADGQRALTPEYAAPEQMRGAPVTTATDVYALGVLLYQLLTGRHPTAADASSEAEVMRATLDTDPPRMTSALTASNVAADRNTTLPRLRRELNGDLENIVARALRKEPLQRYQTIAALADDLRRYRAHEPVCARADSMAYRIAKFARRRRGPVAAALLVMLAATAGITGTISQAQRAEAQAVRAERERDNALRTLGYAQSEAEFIGFLLDESLDKPVTKADLLARAEPLLEKLVPDDPAQRAHLRLIIADLFAQAASREEEHELILRARTDARASSDPTQQAEIDCLLALHHGVVGEFAVAQPLFDAAFATLRAAPEADRLTLAQCLQSRSEVAGIKGEATAALADARAAIEALGTPRPGQRSQSIVSRATLASTLRRTGQLADSVREYQHAIAELEAIGRGQTQQALTMLNNLGVTLSRAGQTLRANDAFKKALDMSQSLGRIDPTFEGNYANGLIKLGRLREAMPLIEHAVAETKARGDKRRGPSFMAEGALAWCLTKDLVRCNQLLATARSELSAVLPAGHTTLGVLEITFSQLASARSEHQQASAALQRAVAIFEGASEKNPAGVRALALLARSEQQLGKLDAAQVHAERAVAQAREAMAGFEHSHWLGGALVALGLVQQSRGEFAAAQASWRAALDELQATLGESAPATEEVRRLLAGA
jgi:eukaryotic-like serine/threonine-protein kinase